MALSNPFTQSAQFLAALSDIDRLVQNVLWSGRSLLEMDTVVRAVEFVLKSLLRKLNYS